MAEATLAHLQQRLTSNQLTLLGRWLMDAAAASLGFSNPQDHPAPPAIGMQPYSGGWRRQGRRQRFWV